jgi:hypothetical protein
MCREIHVHTLLFSVMWWRRHCMCVYVCVCVCMCVYVCVDKDTVCVCVCVYRQYISRSFCVKNVGTYINLYVLSVSLSLARARSLSLTLTLARANTRTKIPESSPSSPAHKMHLK